VTETREITPGVCVSRTIVHGRSDDIPVTLVNLTKVAVKLDKGAFVSALEPVSVCGASEEAPAGPEAEGSVLHDMVSRVDDTVEDPDRRRLLSLLKEYAGAFSKDENDLGRTDVVTHTIDTGSKGALFQRRIVPTCR